MSSVGNSYVFFKFRHSVVAVKIGKFYRKIGMVLFLCFCFELFERIKKLFSFDRVFWAHCIEVVCNSILNRIVAHARGSISIDCDNLWKLTTFEHKFQWSCVDENGGYKIAVCRRVSPGKNEKKKKNGKSCPRPRKRKHNFNSFLGPWPKIWLSISAPCPPPLTHSTFACAIGWLCVFQI